MKDLITWQSEGLNLNGEPFLCTRKAEGYYEYAERLGKDSVTFILVDRTKLKSIGLINESKPPLGKKHILNYSLRRFSR